VNKVTVQLPDSWQTELKKEFKAQMSAGREFEQFCMKIMLNFVKKKSGRWALLYYQDELFLVIGWGPQLYASHQVPASDKDAAISFCREHLAENEVDYGDRCNFVQEASEFLGVSFTESPPEDKKPQEEQVNPVELFTGFFEAATEIAQITMNRSAHDDPDAAVRKATEKFTKLLPPEAAHGVRTMLDALQKTKK
jgi:hypothetical protein